MKLIRPKNFYHDLYITVFAINKTENLLDLKENRLKSSVK